MLEAKGATQRDLDRLKRWNCLKIVMFSKSKMSCRWVKAITSTSEGWAENGLRAKLGTEVWGCWLERSFNDPSTCTGNPESPSCVLGCIRSVASRSRWGGILPLCSSLMRTFLQSCILLWGS